MDRPSGKAKHHQHLRRARQAVLYQMLCRPHSKRTQANNVASPPSFGGRRVAQRTTPMYAVALFRVNAMFCAAGHARRPNLAGKSSNLFGRATSVETGHFKTGRFCSGSSGGRAQQHAFRRNGALFFLVNFDALGERAWMVAAVGAPLGPHPAVGPAGEGLERQRRDARSKPIMHTRGPSALPCR